MEGETAKRQRGELPTMNGVPPCDYERLFDAVPDPCLVLDSNLHICGVNEAYLAATMTKREEILGRYMFDAFPDNPEDPRATGVRNLGASLERVIRERKTDVMPLQKYDIRGPAERGGSFEERYWSPVNTPVLGPKNELLWIIHRVQDVTEFVYLKHKGIEAEKATEELRNRCVQAESELYVKAQEVARANFEIKQLNRKLSEHNQKLLTATSRLQSETAESIRLHESLVHMRADLQTLVVQRTEELRQMYDRLLGETRDKERAEGALRQAQRLEALGTLVGGVVHDLNNVLSAVIGFTELRLDHLPEGSKEDRYAQKVIEAGERGRSLVRQLLNFLKQKEDEKKPIVLGNAVRQTVEFLKPATPSNIEIRLDVQSESGMIFADPTQIQQVTMNLLTNAVHAMRGRGGVLDIVVSEYNAPTPASAPDHLEPGRYMKLVVRDTGAGMPPEVADHVFEPFFTTKEEGTGLGLSVTHSIIKQSSGHIDVWSERGKGTAFTVYLPEISQEGPTADTVVTDEMLPTGSERILFVDDEEAIAEMGGELLAELGYGVTLRTRGTEALAVFRKRPSSFDLIITDQDMPDMTGMELAREVHAIRPDIPVIIVTGFSYAVNEETVNAAGIEAFALKPLTKREMARTIRKVLDKG